MQRLDYVPLDRILQAPEREREFLGEMCQRIMAAKGDQMNAFAQIRGER